MIVSLYGCSGGRSEPQSKNGLITTLVIVWPRESSIGRSPDAESSCSATAMSYEKSCGPCLKSPSNALPYGSSSSLLGSHRCPAAGSHGPSTRKPYRCPGVIAGRYACQTKPSTSSRGMRSSVPASSIRHSSTCSATSENTEKLVPAPSYVAPSGYDVPGHTVARMGPVSGPVSLAVIVRPYRRRSMTAHRQVVAAGLCTHCGQRRVAAWAHHRPSGDPNPPRRWRRRYPQPNRTPTSTTRPQPVIRHALGSVSVPALTPDEIGAIDAAHVWHPYSPVGAQALPSVVAVAARGALLTVIRNGRQVEVLDAMSSWWTAIHGHGQPALDRAITDQLATMNHVMFGGLTHEPAARLSQLLVDITPAGLDTVFFSDSGSVSVEVAVKMALQYWRSIGRPPQHRLMTWRGGYHGDTFTPMSVCDPDGGMHALWTDVLPRQLFAPQVPAHYDAAYSAAFEAQLAQHADELAAVIVEPVVQGAGGMRFHDPRYLRDLRDACRS